MSKKVKVAEFDVRIGVDVCLHTTWNMGNQRTGKPFLKPRLILPIHVAVTVWVAVDR